MRRKKNKKQRQKNGARQTENATVSLRLVQDVIDEWIGEKKGRTTEERIVEKCTVLKYAIGGAFSIELRDIIADGTVSIDMFIDAHWSAVETSYRLATLYRPGAWNRVARTPSFAKLALMPMAERFHGAETPLGVVVWASFADPTMLSESDIATINRCFLQTCGYLTPLTEEMEAALESLARIWRQRPAGVVWNAALDMKQVSQLYDRLWPEDVSTGRETKDDNSDIVATVGFVQTTFAQITIRDLVQQGVPFSAWEDVLEPTFTRWFTEEQRLYTSAQIAEYAANYPAYGPLPKAISSRYAESELTIARAAIYADHSEEDENE